MLTTDAPIIVSETYPVKVQTVWSALTELNKLREWFFEDIPEYKAEVGFETTFDIQATSHLFPHHWTVTEVIENKRLATKWDFTGFEGQSLVTFDLEDLEGSTKLTVTAKAISDFDQDIPEFRRESGVGGWEYFLKDKLKAYLG